MAFQVQRKSRLRETLELVSADGENTLSIDVDLNLDEMGGRIVAAQDVMTMAAQLVAQEPQSVKAQEAFGSAVIALFGGVFGEADTKRILDFYDGHYAEMLTDIAPFISNVVFPAIKKASADRKQRLLDAANSMRR